MKMMKWILLLLLFWLAAALHAEKLGLLPDIHKPLDMDVFQHRLYISEGAAVKVFSLPGLALVHTLGREGEGPGEIKAVPFFNTTVHAGRDGIMIESYDKLVFFAPDGSLKRELKKPGMIFQVLPLGDGFAAVQMMTQEEEKKVYLSLALFDQGMKRIGEIHKQEYPEYEYKIVMITDAIYFTVDENHLYVERSDLGFVIQVFDAHGGFVKEIRKETEPVSITTVERERILEQFKSDSLFSLVSRRNGGWQEYLKTLTLIYPKKYPDVLNITVSGPVLWATTAAGDDTSQVFVRVDLRSATCENIVLPRAAEPGFTAQQIGRRNRFCTFSENFYYYLRENADTEVWELYAVELDH